MEVPSDEQITLLERLKSILEISDKAKIHNLRNADSTKVKQTTAKVNEILKFLPTSNITEVKNVLRASAILVCELIDIKEHKKKERKEPFWKRRIEGDIKKLRQDLSRIDMWFKGKWRNAKAKEKQDLDKKYKLKAKGFNTVREELRQRITAKSTKIRRYSNRIKQFQDNRLYKSNQGMFFKQINGGQERTIPPNPGEATKFWNDIWGNKVRHNKNAEWIKSQKRKIAEVRQADVVITLADVKEKIKKIPSWKGPGPDDIQGYWIKNFTELHDKIAENLQHCLRTREVPHWLVEGRTILVMKDTSKGTEVGNYRPIACLNLLWKLLSGILSDKTYTFLETNKLLPDEQKGCRRKCQGTKDQLAIDRSVLRNCKRRKTNLSMAWVDFKKAYDMVPHSWIVESMRMLGVASNIIELIGKSMSNWRTNLFSDGKLLGSVKINRGIFQGDSFSPLMFVIAFNSDYTYP